jgi:hypothetical protein
MRFTIVNLALETIESPPTFLVCLLGGQYALTPTRQSRLFDGFSSRGGAWPGA